MRLPQFPLAIGAVAILLCLAGCGSNPPTTSPQASSPAPSIRSVSSDTPTVSASTAASPSASPAPTPPAGFAVLDGMPADPAVADRLPVAVMVDDNIVARPQYGLNAASIVYQAPADGGEDRYMLVFQEQDAKRVEAIRSGRPYFVNWASEYRAAFAHYGGDAKTLAFLPTINGKVLYNVDALSGAGSVYHRDSARVAPHNAYGSTAVIRAFAIAHGAPALMPSSAGFRPFTDDLPASQRPTKGSITIPYGTGATGYAYDAKSNSYLRSVAGKPQIDAADGKRVTARNVVVLFMALSIDPQSEPGHARPMLAQIGSGKALGFHDGHVVVGTWRKDTASSLTRFFDAQGVEIPLVRGRIFIQVVPTGAKVTYDATATP